MAINQAKALTALGHEVVVAAAAGGFDGPLPSSFDGYPVRLFPARRLIPASGFAGLASPGLLKWLAKNIRWADIIHVHLARDLVTLPAAAVALMVRKPVFIQTHGMIDRTSKLLAKPLDLFFTRPILNAARVVLYLTDRERKDLMGVAGKRLVLRHLPNGVSLLTDDMIKPAADKAQEVEVLYLARLHTRKRPKEFVTAAKQLLGDGLSASFKLVGPDEGEVSTIRHIIDTCEFSRQIIYEGPIAPDKTLQRMMECDIYVLPSVNEPFPMSVIEAMATGKPVIITETCGLSQFVLLAGAGLVVDESQSALTSAIARLVQDEGLRLAMGKSAKQLVIKEFAIESVAEKLEHFYTYDT